MKKEILIKGIAVPLIAGLLLSIAFLFFIDAHMFSPASDGAVIAHHDEMTQHDSIGTLSFGSTSLPIYKNADYSSLADGASLEYGTALDEQGLSYIKVLHNNISTLLDDNISIAVGNDECIYRHKSTFKADSEQAVRLRKPAVSKGIVIYYQISNGAGFSDRYEALVYEEVR